MLTYSYSMTLWMYSFRRSFGWTWTTKLVYISSRILSMRVWVHCSLRWLRLSIVGLNIGGNPSIYWELFHRVIN